MIDRKPIEELVVRVGEILLSYRPKTGSGNGSLKIETKGDGSPVSEADLASAREIESTLAKLYPDIPIVCEENIPENLEEVFSKPYWLVDPLDGTRSFIQGKDDFSVLIALIEDGFPKFGCMYFPVFKKLAIAEKGCGVTYDNRPLKISNFDYPRHGKVYIRNFEPKQEPELKSIYMDSCLAFLQVASGELDGAIIKMSMHRAWDIAPAQLMIEESGGVVTNQEGKRISYKALDLGGGYIVASSPRLTPKLLDLIP